MGKRNRNQGKGKLAVQEGDVVFVGVDCHKKDLHVAVRINGELRTCWVTPRRAGALVKQLHPLRVARTEIVYEAGPTGYGLARRLERAGFGVRVTPPGKTPREPNRGNKSDRLDAKKLAELAEGGRLPAVGIPTEQEDADRQIVRLRAQLLKKVRRTKQQIKGMLLYNELPSPSGWGPEQIARLRDLPMRKELRLVLDVRLDELAYQTAQLQRATKLIADLAKTARHAAHERRVRTHPGVGALTAMDFLAEVYQPERFRRTEEVVCYVGLAPSVRESGERRQEGGCVKGGRPELRRLLVQAAWRWIRLDPGAAEVYRRLVQNTGDRRIAIVAMARRMLVNLWCMRTRGEPYRSRAAA